MAACEYCELLNRNKPTEILYEDKEVVVAIKDTALTVGQITVFPKEHITILEGVPNPIIEKCAQVANKVSRAIFDSFGCQGTNIIIENGIAAGQKVPHFALEIVPRREQDGLDLQWPPKQLMEDEMDTVFIQLKDAADKIILTEKKKVETVKVPEQKTEKVQFKENQDNYLLKSLRRVP